MTYEYNKKIVNNGNVNNFFDKNNFIGYILPDGSIYECQEHNVSNAATFFSMFLNLLNNDYGSREVLLDEVSDDKLNMVIINYLRYMSPDMVHALYNFINENNFSISELLVSLFGCHLITRLRKEIITSESNHACFYNYLLNDFYIKTIDKIVYDEESKKYKRVHLMERNDYLYDEISRIKKDAINSDIELFYRTR